MRTDTIVMTILNDNQKVLKKALGEAIAESESHIWQKNKDLRTEVNRLEQTVKGLERQLDIELNDKAVVTDYGASMEDLVNKLSAANQQIEDMNYYYRSMIEEFIVEIENKTGDRKLAETYVENLWYRYAMKKGAKQ